MDLAPEVLHLQRPVLRHVLKGVGGGSIGVGLGASAFAGWVNAWCGAHLVDVDERADDVGRRHVHVLLCWPCVCMRACIGVRRKVGQPYVFSHIYLDGGPGEVGADAADARRLQLLDACDGMCVGQFGTHP